jgi:hypothetical protein
MLSEGYEDDGPSPEDLAAIEDEWPVIEAETALTDAEIRLITVGRRKATELDWQRVRTAERAVLAAWLVYRRAVTGEAVA